MTTIIVPVQTPSSPTRTYTFESDTEHGGLATITVRVPASASEEYARKEAEGLLRSGVALRSQKSQDTLSDVYLVTGVLLFVGGFVGLMLITMLDMAGLFPASAYWNKGIPVVGGTTLGVGLLRIYLMLWGAWLFVPYFLFRAMRTDRHLSEA